MKFNIVLLLVTFTSAIKIKEGGKSFIHLKLVEDPPATKEEDGAKAPGKDLSESAEPKLEYATSTRVIPEGHGSKELKVYNGKPEPVPLVDSWPAANGESPDAAAPKDASAKPAAAKDGAKPAEAVPAK